MSGGRNDTEYVGAPGLGTRSYFPRWAKATRLRLRWRQVVADVDETEVLLLWRALNRFRSGARPECRPRGRTLSSPCPMFVRCPRWGEADDRRQSLEETFDQAERRRSTWPCSRLLDLLGPEVDQIGR
jgi:hypothetical protein